MAEYGVVLAVITVGIVVALTRSRDGISGALDSVVDKLTPAGNQLQHT